MFHRKVNRRALPEYYEVIKEPMALSTVKVPRARRPLLHPRTLTELYHCQANINNRTFRSFSEFVRDFALVRPPPPTSRPLIVVVR